MNDRTRLVDMLTNDLLQGRMEHMSACVVPCGCLAFIDIDSGDDWLRLWLFPAVTNMNDQIAFFANIHHTPSSLTLLYHPLVCDLSSRFGIEGCRVQSKQPLPRFVFCIAPDPRFRVVGIVPYESRMRSNFQFLPLNLSSLKTSRFTSFGALGFHTNFETCFVQLKLTFFTNQTSQINWEAVGVIKLERIFAAELFLRNCCRLSHHLFKDL